ncbi:MAG: hypothetical protein QOF40_664 [Actinomycetota bacterium]|nr:hypothetical protein [Actinomycetota bacterium]
MSIGWKVDAQDTGDPQNRYVLAEPMDVPNVGRIAALMDPQGAVFSVIKNAQPA